MFRPDRVLSANSFQFLHYREDEQEREQAKHDKYAPYGLERNVSPKESWYRHKHVAYGGGYKPAAHHEALVFGRSHFRYEAYAHWRKQQLAKCQYKICGHEPIGRHARTSVVRKPHRAYHHHNITTTGNKHSESNFAWSRRLFAFACQPAKNSHRHRCEHNHKAGVELLEDWSCDFNTLR